MTRIKAIPSFFCISTLGLLLGKACVLFGLPTFTPDLACLVLIIYIWTRISIFRFEKNKFLTLLCIFLILSILFCFSKLITSAGLTSSISSFYRIILLQIFILVGYALPIADYKKIFNQQNKLFLLLALIALLQFVFWEKLPRIFLSPSLIDNHVDGILVGNIRGIRSNGLFGNPLELMAFACILIFLSNKNNIIKSAVILVTLSRTGFILLAARFMRKSFLLILFISSFCIYFVYTKGLNLGLFSRLLFRTSESSDSTSSRLNYIREISKFDLSELLYGLDLGSISARSRSDNSIEIYDGFFLNILVEYGVIYFTLYSFVMLVIFYNIFQKNSTNGIIMSLLFMVLGLTGSAQLHATVGGLIYLALGFNLRNGDRISFSSI